MKLNKIRCCTFCSDSDAQEVTEINKDDLFFCDNCGFISADDTVMLYVEEIQDDAH